MANTRSARKRIKQNEKRRLRNRAVTQGIIHRNTAARRKSALARKLNAPA